MKNKRKMHPSFWFMTDTHMFYRPKGGNVKEVTNDLLRLAKENPYGMVCPVTMLDDNNQEIKRIGTPAHVDKNGNVDMSQWLSNVMKEDDIVNL